MRLYIEKHSLSTNIFGWTSSSQCAAGVDALHSRSVTWGSWVVISVTAVPINILRVGNNRLLALALSGCYNIREVIHMETKDVILTLRNQKGLSQEALAAKVYVTRQAVSRWETGETVPSPETLKLLSSLFDVSINTLLGSPRKLTCQCCGMPLDDSIVSREPDGEFNEDYCKWCYADGKFIYTSIEELIDFLVKTMTNESFPPEQARVYFEEQLPKLKHWQQTTE